MGPTTRGFQLQDFANRLDRWLEYLGWDLQTFSRETGIHRPVVWRWRSGAGFPSFAKADVVLQTLALPLLEFFDETPGERIRRALERACEGGAEGSLARLAGLRPGDFLCAMSRVPRCVLPGPATDVLPTELGDADSCFALVDAPLVGTERYPLVAREGRRRVVTHEVSVLEHTARARGFRPEDVATLEAAWRRLDEKTDA